jgi:hypothetical protein
MMSQQPKSRVESLSELESRWKLINLRVDTVVKVLSVTTIIVAVVIAWTNIANQQEQARQYQEREEQRRQKEFEEAQRRIIEEAKLSLRREDAQNLAISLNPRLVATDTDSPLIIADVTLKNIGRVPIWAGARVDDSSPGEGCELTVIEYENHAVGKAADVQIIDWSDGGGEHRYLLEKYNLLSSYTSYRKGSYVLNPGVEYHEAGVVPVTKGKLYGVRARFFTEEGWTAADIAYVYVPKSIDQ